MDTKPTTPRKGPQMPDREPSFIALPCLGPGGNLYAYSMGELVRLATFNRLGDAECAARLFEEHVNGPAASAGAD